MKTKNYLLISLIVIIVLLLIYIIFICPRYCKKAIVHPIALVGKLSSLPPGTPIHTDNGGCNLQVSPNPPTPGNQVILLVKEITGFPMNLTVTDVDNNITNPQNLRVDSGSYWCGIYGYLNPFHNIIVKVDPILPNDPNRDPATIHANAYQLSIFEQNKPLPDNVGSNVYAILFPNIHNDRYYFIDISVQPPNTQVSIQESFNRIESNYIIKNKLLLCQFVPKLNALNYSLTHINPAEPPVVINVYYMDCY